MKQQLIRFALAIVIFSAVAFALTTVTDNGISVTTGNVTADWFIGKVNASDIQNNVYNYNQTIASGDGSYNSSYAEYAYNQTILAIAEINKSFNKSATDLYYSSIIWGYNQSDVLHSLFGKFWYNMTIGTGGDGSYNITYDATSQDVTANRTSWTNNYNSSYDAKISYNSTFNQTLTDARYALVGAVGGNPFNQNLNTTSESALGALNVSLTTSSGDRGPAVNIVSRNQNQSAVWITGNESDKGTLKIAHTGYVGDSSSSAISIDLQGPGTSSKGIFITSTTGGTTGRYLYISNGSADVYSINNQVQQTFRPTITTSSNASALLVEKDDGTDIFKVDTVSDLIYTGTLRPRTNMTQDVGQASLLYRGAYFDQNVTARYFKGDGSLLTNLPTSGGAYNATYDATSQDVTANRSLWFYNMSFNKSATDLYYSPIGYNQTTPAISYTDIRTGVADLHTHNVANITSGTTGANYVFTEIQTYNNNITMNTTSAIVFSNASSGMYQNFNGTCIIIQGATSRMEIC